jgi:hypothetical protein
MNVEAFSSKGQKLTLKEPTGWFAAGESFRRALLLLSDGAFKMFAYLCLQADRRTARVETTHRELAQALGKSKRAIGTYVGELEKHRICCAHAGRNQFARTVFEIEENYWPYDRLASGSEPTQERTYIDSVRQAFLALACGSGKFTSADTKTARQMEADGIPLEIIQDAILLGSCRKYISWLNGGSADVIGSLRYFAQAPAGFFNHVLSVTFLADVSLNCDRSSAKVNNFGHGALSSRQATDLWSAILLCQRRFGQIAHASKSRIWTPFS